jgi:hypothetical protein
MSASYPQMVDVGKTTFCGLPPIIGMVQTIGMTERPLHPEIGQRLAAVRLAFSDLSQGAWAERHGFNPTQWNNWERGVRRIPVEAAEHLCEVYGLTLDFVYRGRRDGLSETASKVL